MTLLMGRPCSGQASSEGALQPRLGRGAMRFVSGQTITEGVQIDRGPALLQHKASGRFRRALRVYRKGVPEHLAPPQLFWLRGVRCALAFPVAHQQGAPRLVGCYLSLRRWVPAAAGPPPYWCVAHPTYQH